MSDHRVKILRIEQLTPNVKSFIVEKPKGYVFHPGSHTHIKLEDSKFKDKKHPFTICSLNRDNFLEFIIKGYPGGITEELHDLKEGDEIIIDDPKEDKKYKGKGFFIAAGTGVNPFLAILRHLREENQVEGNKLIFTNKTYEDIILRKELKNLLDDDLILVLTRQKVKGYHYGRIDSEFLKETIKDFSQYFYLCGPKIFALEVKKMLLGLGASMEKIF